MASSYKINKRIKTQVIIEFVSAFIILLIFLVATAKIFAWFCGTVLERHEAFESSRTDAGKVDVDATGATIEKDRGSFYDESSNPLNIFNE